MDQKSKKRQDILRDNESIRTKLKQRFSDQGLMLKDITEDAASLGHKIDTAALSRYLNDDQSGKSLITQEDVIWLCRRYMIKVDIFVQEMDYKKEAALQRMKNGKKQTVHGTGS